MGARLEHAGWPLCHTSRTSKFDTGTAENTPGRATSATYESPVPSRRPNGIGRRLNKTSRINTVHTDREAEIDAENVYHAGLQTRLRSRLAAQLRSKPKPGRCPETGAVRAPRQGQREQREQSRDSNVAVMLLKTCVCVPEKANGANKLTVHRRARDRKSVV